jgi:hypothetical protein
MITFDPVRGFQMSIGYRRYSIAAWRHNMQLLNPSRRRHSKRYAEMRSGWYYKNNEEGD